jgi:RIO kinase 3
MSQPDESAAAVVYSLENVMSEQLATELDAQETAFILKQYNIIDERERAADDEEPAIVLDRQDFDQTPNQEIDSDYMLAQLVQLELDKEYDEALRLREQQENKCSRVTVSYDNFRAVHPVIEQSEKDLDKRRHRLDRDSSNDDENDQVVSLTFKRGIHTTRDGQVISKHDLGLASKHNASKVMNLFAPEFETGDSRRINMRLSNQVYNTLKIHSMHTEKRKNRLHDKKDHATNTMSLDPRTRLILFKLVNADIISEIGGVISTGKEATIFYAQGGKSVEVLVPANCVAKVYKTTLNEFKTREKYIRDDYRFRDRYKHLNPRKIVKLWAEKEMHNLMKMRKFGIRCPDVIVLKKHVLIMSMIGGGSSGSQDKPAPKLKEALLSYDELKSAYDQSLSLISDLYSKCNLVHADFNQFNLLWFEGQVWVCDVSQSVETIHPRGLEFLLRDCANISKFFASRKLDCVKTAEEMFREVTGMDFKGEGDFFLSQIQHYIKDKFQEQNKQLNREPNEIYNFDYHFNKELNQKLKGDDSDSDSDSSDDE